MERDFGEGFSQVDLELDLQLGRWYTSWRKLRNKIKELPTVEVGGHIRLPSIWRVHSRLRRKDREAYEPSLVSIGPLNRRDHGLLPIDGMKLENLRQLHILLRGNKLDICVKKVFGCLSKARDVYSEKLVLSDEEFAEMLVVDGCFIIEYIVWQAFRTNDIEQAFSPTDIEQPFLNIDTEQASPPIDFEQTSTPIDFDQTFPSIDFEQSSTPVDFEQTFPSIDIEQAFLNIDIERFAYKFKFGFPSLRRDLMLLENQIPFFILNLLFEEIKILYPEVMGEGLDLVSVALRFLEINLPLEYPRPSKVLHLLHLQHLCHDPRLARCHPYERSDRQLAMSPVKKLTGLIFGRFLDLLYQTLFGNCFGLFGAARKLRAPRTTPSATELREAGVKFKRKETPEDYEKACLLHISFEDGTLEIPSLLVTDSTSTELKNLVAFEQCYRNVSPYFTNYCSFMDHIINTADDVAILRRSGILESHLGSDAEVAEMFNGLCKEAFLGRQTFYAKVDKELRAFCQVPHHRWRANLVQKYFSNPWTIISLIAGTLLLVFTGLQTFWKRN